MSGCPSFLPGQGRGGAGRDLSEVDDSLKFVLFFFTVKNSEYKSPQVRCRSQQVLSQWLFARFLGGRRLRSTSLLPNLSADLQDVGNQQVVECLRFEKSYHWILRQVSNGNLSLEHNTTLPFNIYSFALASIFLRGRTYLPILTHPVCRLDGSRERLAERPFERRERSESRTNFLYFSLDSDLQVSPLSFGSAVAYALCLGSYGLLPSVFLFPGVPFSFSFLIASVPVSCIRCRLVADGDREELGYLLARRCRPSVPIPYYI